MIERDEELRKVLRQWETPGLGPALDARVRNAFRDARSSRPRKWLPVAAGVLLATGSAALWMHPARTAAIETKIDAIGFRPVAAGTITVVPSGEKQ
jgi:hypothetical protein